MSYFEVIVDAETEYLHFTDSGITKKNTVLGSKREN